MSRELGRKGKTNVEAILNKKDVQRNSVIEKYSQSELIAELKGLALDPCCPQFTRDNIRPLYNRILLLRKFMVLNNSEIPSKKRKLEQLLKDKVKASSSLTIPDQQNVSKESKRKLSHSASVSCLVNVSESSKPPADKTIIYSHSSNSLSKFNDPIENCQGKDMVIDSDESAIDSSPPTHNLICATSSEPNKKNLNSTRKSNRVSNFIGDHLQKCVVPVGPRFQAVVPEFSGTLDKNDLIDQYKKWLGTHSDNSKWLGTQIWPVEMSNARNDKIGKGRTDICQCMMPNSAECVKRHSLEARMFLRCDLGSAFFSWKFDEMGEQIAKLWTSKEQQTFESLLKIRPSTNGKNFLKRALKSIPKKSRKEIVNYYFNVYIPRRLSLQTRSSSKKVVDSDDEDEPKRYEGKVVTTSKSKKVKDQYLRA